MSTTHFVACVVSKGVVFCFDTCAREREEGGGERERERGTVRFLFSSLCVRLEDLCVWNFDVCSVLLFFCDPVFLCARRGGRTVEPRERLLQ